MKSLALSLFAAAILMAPDAHAGKPRSWFSPIRASASPGAGVVLIVNFRVFSNAYTCADSFANVQASLSGNRLTLAYRHILPDTTRPPCLPSPMDYGPTFRLPALHPGYYEIHEQVWTCSPDAPLCEQPAPTYLGLLAVGDMVSHWDMHPDTVDAGRPFSLQLLNEAYGNCYVGFSDTGVILARTGPFNLTFAVDYYPARLCLVDVHPHGPTFSMPGLPDGRHPVGILERPDCMKDSLPCNPVIRGLYTIDTLVVRPATGIRSGNGPGPRLREPPSPGQRRGYRLDGRKAQGRKSTRPVSRS